MIVILGDAGYVGTCFRQGLEAKQIPYIGLSRSEINYSDSVCLTEFLKSHQPEFLINAAGYTGKPNVDACEDDKAECLFGNAILPGRIAQACRAAGVPWGHVSSGCIYTGSRDDGKGFTEEDAPNFTFRQDNCSWYSGTKALGEEMLWEYEEVYIWRLRIPFGWDDHPRNYISKLIRYERLLDATNSISNLVEFVSAALGCWEQRVPYGIYNMTNPGAISARELTDLIREFGISKKLFSFFENEAAFMRQVATAPRSNCILSTDKLTSVGIEMTPVHESVRSCLSKWASVGLK